RSGLSPSGGTLALEPFEVVTRSPSRTRLGRTADGCADTLVARADAFVHAPLNFVRVRSGLSADVHRPDPGADVGLEVEFGTDVRGSRPPVLADHDECREQ